LHRRRPVRRADDATLDPLHASAAGRHRGRAGLVGAMMNPANLDDVIKEMYDSICFDEGQRPDWSRLSANFAPGARLVRVTDDGVFEFDMESYRINLEAMIDSGAMASFWEAEIWRETRQFGEV